MKVSEVPPSSAERPDPSHSAREPDASYLATKQSVTPTRLLLDVNVWVALFDDAHVASARANALIETPGIKIATCPLVESGVIRVLNFPATGDAARWDHGGSTTTGECLRRAGPRVLAG